MGCLGLLSLGITVSVSLVIAAVAWFADGNWGLPLGIASVAAGALTWWFVTLIRHEEAESNARLEALARDGFERERIEGER